MEHQEGKSENSQQENPPTDSQFQQNPYNQQGYPNQFSGQPQYGSQGYQHQQSFPGQYQGQQYPSQFQGQPQFSSQFQGQPGQPGPNQYPQQFQGQYQQQQSFPGQFQGQPQQFQGPPQQGQVSGQTPPTQGTFPSQFPQTQPSGQEQKEGGPPQPYVYINDNQPIDICVCDPLVKDGITKHVVYKIKGFDREGVFEVYRRYNDFFHLRNMLLQRWPGCLIPPIPPKKAMGNMDQKFIADRKRFLDDFVKKLAQVRYLFYSEEFRTFLRSGAGDMEKTLNTLHKQTHEETVLKYKAVFPEVVSVPF